MDEYAETEEPFLVLGSSSVQLQVQAAAFSIFAPSKSMRRCRRGEEGVQVIVTFISPDAFGL